MRRRLVTVVLGGAALVALAGPAAAQGAPGGDTPEPVATVPAPSTTTTVPRPTTTLARCDEPPPVAVVFTGTVAAVDRRAVTYTVDAVAKGSLPFKETVVDYPDDSRFLRLGQRYRVTAAADNEVQRFVSKVRPRRGTPAHCAAKDPILTTLPDGTAIDTGLLSGMSGHWSTAVWYVLAPLGVAIGVLTALSVLKHGFGWTGRTVWRRLSRSRPPRSPRSLGP